MTMVSQRPSTGTPNSPPLFRCGWWAQPGRSLTLTLLLFLSYR
jgi:hypothetical protein